MLKTLIRNIINPPDVSDVLYRDPAVNIWSNLAYAAVGAAYIYHGLSLERFSASLCIITGIALCVLAFGSWRMHAANIRINVALDHVGMNFTFLSLACFLLDPFIGGNGYAAILLIVLLLAVNYWVGYTRYLGGGVEFSRPRSLLVIAGCAPALFILLFLNSWQAALLTTLIFGIAFLFHDRGKPTATGFGALHSIWHLLTAKGLLIPLLYRMSWFIF